MCMGRLLLTLCSDWMALFMRQVFVFSPYGESFGFGLGCCLPSVRDWLLFLP